MSGSISSNQGFFWNDTVTPESASDLESVFLDIQNSGTVALAASIAATAAATAAEAASATAAAVASSAVTTINNTSSAAVTTINNTVTSATTTLNTAATAAASSASSASSSASSATSSASSATSSATSAGTSATAAASSATTAAGSATAAATSATNAATSASSVSAVVSGGTLTVPSMTTSTLFTQSGTSSVVVKNGPSGNILMTIGGSSGDVAMKTNLTIPGGTWGTGNLANDVAPIFQNATFAGTTANGAAAFGAFLQQTDNSVNTGAAVGFYEHLILSGSLVSGGREAGQFTLDINATTANTSNQDYTALGSKCNLNATDGGSGAKSSAFGFNPVASIGQNVTASQCVGTEVNTWIQSGATVTDRIGLQVVDVVGSTYGVQASRDDVGLSVNNQYAPSSSLGFKTGFSFGRSGGQFPVATNGTLIAAQATSGGTWTVAKGIDWSLGTASSYWLKFGSLTLLDGSGNLNATTVKSNGGIGAFGTTPPGSKPTITGSRGSATATVLASLLTALAAAGFITDSTTA